MLIFKWVSQAEYISLGLTREDWAGTYICAVLTHIQSYQN